jgi:hypothetical protein
MMEEEEGASGPRWCLHMLRRWEQWRTGVVLRTGTGGCWGRVVRRGAVFCSVDAGVVGYIKALVGEQEELLCEWPWCRCRNWRRELSSGTETADKGPRPAIVAAAAAAGLDPQARPLATVATFCLKQRIN